MEPLVSIRDYVSLHDLRLAIEGEKSAILVDMLWFIENRLGHQNSLTDTEMFKLVVSRSILRKNQHSNLQMGK